MRRFLPIVLAVTAACSSGSTGGTTPDTPVATTMAISTGDNQQATAGSPVAIRPAVVVRDQDGQAMKGATVTFTPDSGGGTVTGASAVSGNDGVATVGSWTLGPAAGLNRLRASTGSLTPVFFAATAVASGGSTLADVTIPASGGTVTVSRAGDPLNGMRVVVPGGAFPGAVEFTISPATAPAPVAAGLTWISPVVNITSSSGGYTAGAPFTLDIPAAVSPGYVPVAVLMNAATGAVETAPAVAVNGSTVRMITRHLSGSALSGSIGSALRTNAVIQVVIGQVRYEDLLQDISTTYNPLIDDWDFPVTTALGGHELSTTLHFASAITALAWFRSQSAHGTLHLGARFDDAPGVWQSDERSYKMAGVVATMVGNGEEDYNNALAALASTIAVSVDSLQLLSVKSSMFVTGHPQLMEGRTGTDDVVATFVVYGSSSSGLKASFGMSNNILIGTRVIGYSNGSFAPMTISAVNPETDAVFPWSVTISRWLAFGESAGVRFDAVDALWDAVRNRTIGETPPVKLESNGESRIAADTVVVWADGSRVWTVCGDCPRSYTPSSLIQPSGPLLGERLWTLNGGTWTAAGVTGKEQGVLVHDADGRVVVTPIGAELFQTAVEGSSLPDYLDWRFYFIKYVKLSIAPDSTHVTGDQPFTLTATYSDPPPANAQWVWDMGDGRTLTTATNTLTTSYPPPPAGTQTVAWPVKVTLDSASKVWARAAATATVVVGPPRWQITSFVQTSFSNTLPVPPIETTLAALETRYRETETELRDSLVARPAGGVIQLFGAGEAPAQMYRSPLEDTHLYPWLLALHEAPGAATMYLTFPRGPMVLAGLLATTGTPAIVPGFGGFTYNPFQFVNQFVTSVTSPKTYTGQAATKALGSRSDMTAQQSVVMMHLEINAVTTPTGLSGTITFVATIICFEDQAFLSGVGCGDPIKGELRRVYNFTAVAH